MSVLNHIDRFIFSLWERNDQLSVYNPQIKTQYDTYSWVKDIGGGNPIKAKEFIQLYKLDLLETLKQNDNFPLQYIESDGIAFMRWALSRDIRNMLRWLRGPDGKGPQAILKDSMTYIQTLAQIEDRSLPLGYRDRRRQNGTGFLYTDFVDIVREEFRLGKSGTDVFEHSADDDHGHFASNYFWFMYGILPRNGITLDSLKNGLELDSPNPDDIRNTFKFLGLLYNLKSEKVEILRGPDKDGKPDVEGIYDFIDPWKEIPRPFDHKVMYVDKARNELHQRQEKDKSKDGNSDRPENEKTKRLQREIDDINKRVKDYMEKNTKWRDNTDQNKKVTNWNKAKQDKQNELNAERNRLKAEKDDGNTDKQGSRHQKKVASSSERTSNERPAREQRPSTPVEQRRQNTPPRQAELRQQSTPPRQTEPRRQQSPPQRQTSVTPSPSVQSPVSTTPQFFPLDESEDEDSVQPDTTKVPPASRSVAKDPTQTGASSIAAPVPTAPIPAPKRGANPQKPFNRGNLAQAIPMGGGIAATAPVGGR